MFRALLVPKLCLASTPSHKKMQTSYHASTDRCRSEMPRTGSHPDRIKYSNDVLQPVGGVGVFAVLFRRVILRRRILVGVGGEGVSRSLGFQYYTFRIHPQSYRDGVVRTRRRY